MQNKMQTFENMHLDLFSSWNKHAIESQTLFIAPLRWLSRERHLVPRLMS